MNIQPLGLRMVAVLALLTSGLPPPAQADYIMAEDLRRRLHITLDHEVEVLEHQFARTKVTRVSAAGDP
jgi:hypothetical protein